MSWARQGEEAGECLKMQKLCLCIALSHKRIFRPWEGNIPVFAPEIWSLILFHILIFVCLVFSFLGFYNSLLWTLSQIPFTSLDVESHLPGLSSRRNLCVFCFFNFWPYCMWDQTYVPYSRSTESWPLAHQGSPCITLVLPMCKK